MQASHKVSAVFDDSNLIGSAGLVPVMRLADRARLHDLLREHLSVPCPNAPVKAAGIVAGMLAVADSIDDLNVLRHGGIRTHLITVPARIATTPSPLSTEGFGWWRYRNLD